MGSISCHITPLVITSLGGGHTHTLHGQDKFLWPACAWFKNLYCYQHSCHYGSKYKLSSMMTFNSKVNNEPQSIHCWISLSSTWFPLYNHHSTIALVDGLKLPVKIQILTLIVMIISTTPTQHWLLMDLPHLLLNIPINLCSFIKVS